MNWKLLVVLILLLFIVIFTVQNHDITEINFLIWSFKTSRAVIIFLALSIGFITGWVASLLSKAKK